MGRVIILAGGKGERLRPYTEDKPKCMIPVLGSPLLAFQLRWLSEHGYSDVTVCCGYRNEIIKDHFGDGSRYQVRLNYLVESEPLGRGGALRNALGSLSPGDEPVLAINGDSLTNLNLDELLAFHKQHSPMATLVSVPLKSPFGIITTEDESIVTGFSEKPELPFWVNAGIYMLQPAILPYLPAVGDHEVETFPKLAKDGSLRTFKSRAFWKTIDTVKDLTEVKGEFEEMLFGAFLKSVRKQPTA